MPDTAPVSDELPSISECIEWLTDIDRMARRSPPLGSLMAIGVIERLKRVDAQTRDAFYAGYTAGADDTTNYDWGVTVRGWQKSWADYRSEKLKEPA